MRLLIEVETSEVDRDREYYAARGVVLKANRGELFCTVSYVKRTDNTPVEFILPGDTVHQQVVAQLDRNAKEAEEKAKSDAETQGEYGGAVPLTVEEDRDPVVDDEGVSDLPEGWESHGYSDLVDYATVSELDSIDGRVTKSKIIEVINAR